MLATTSGYTGGWTLITPLILTPFLLLTWWIFFGAVTYGGARGAGGHRQPQRHDGDDGADRCPADTARIERSALCGGERSAAGGLEYADWLLGRADDAPVELAPAALVTIVPYVLALLLLPLLAAPLPWALPQEGTDEPQ